jgi:hypothetical protein
VKKSARAFLAALWTLLPPAVSGVCSTGCGGGPESQALQDGIGTVSEENSNSDPVAPETAVPCGVPAEGCPCDVEGATVQCPGPKIHTGNYTTCAPGKRACLNRVWGPCVGKTIYEPSTH